MSSFRDLLTEAKVNALHYLVDSGSKRFLCYTRYSVSSDSLILCVSDGCDVWKLEMDEHEFNTRRDIAKINSSDAYLSKFRNAVVSGDIIISETGSRVTLTVGKGVNVLEFELYEAKAAEKKMEIQTVLFRLAEAATDLESKLATANQKVEALRQSKVLPSGGDGFLDPDSGRKKGQAKATPRNVGMSVLNPGSKKRKAAKGVEFD